MCRCVKWIMTVFLCAVLFFTGAIGAFAVELISENAPTVSDAPVSPGLQHVASETDMAVSARVGELCYFEYTDFCRAMNLSDLSYITVTKAPDAAEGTLFLGESAVQSGQVISKANIGRLTYAPAGTEGGVGTFEFSVNGSGYSIVCRICHDDDLGTAPTGAGSPAAALVASTYRDLSCTGVLGGYDPDGDPIVYEIVSAPKHGAVRILDREAGTYRYTPFSGYTGKDSFSYVVRDRKGNYSESRSVQVEITEPSAWITFDDLESDSMQSLALTMAEHRIMSGTTVGGKTFFYPDETVSRVDFLVMAMRTVGVPCAENGDVTVFRDHGEIPEALSGYVAQAYAKGVISGTFGRDGLYFQPNRAVTRAEAAKILSGLITLSDCVPSALKAPTDIAVSAVTFTDESTIPAWAEEAVYHLSAVGVFYRDNGMASVTASLTRVDAAEMLASILRVME